MKKKFKKIIVIEKIEGGGEGRDQEGLVAAMIMPQQWLCSHRHKEDLVGCFTFKF